MTSLPLPPPPLNGCAKNLHIYQRRRWVLIGRVSRECIYVHICKRLPASIMYAIDRYFKMCYAYTKRKKKKWKHNCIDDDATQRRARLGDHVSAACSCSKTHVESVLSCLCVCVPRIYTACLYLFLPCILYANICVCVCGCNKTSYVLAAAAAATATTTQRSLAALIQTYTRV